MEGYLDAGCEMVELAKCPYSRREVEAAGDALRGVLPALTDEAIAIFRIAHSWREAHVAPMQKLRRELAWAAKKANASQAINAARLKRMKSIRKKLRNTPLSLYQIQDIAGCRAIVDSMDDLGSILSIYRSGRFKHGLIREWDYIAEPKPDGYRSYHLAFKFSGEGKFEIFNRQRVEVQLRTRMQHAWATAVEAAGLVRGEDLKGGSGDKDWLRLFALMGAEMAAEEGQPAVPGVPTNQKERRQELRDLNTKIGAARNLKNWNEAIKHTEKIIASRSMFYLIQFDNSDASHPVANVQPFFKFRQGADQLHAAEQNDEHHDTVIVEMDAAEDLREAYPNYFLDVTIFHDRLVAALQNGKLTPLKQLYRKNAPPTTRPEEFTNLRRWFPGSRGDS